MLALLGFSTAARKLAPRDRFIGWTPALWEKNLLKVIDNARFLILSWIEIPNLASHVLSAVCRQLIRDWTARYNTTPVLIETFVENAPLHRHRLPGLRMDPCGNHQGTWTLRPAQEVRQAEEGHLVAAPAKGLETILEPLTRWNESTTQPRTRTPLDSKNRPPASSHPPGTVTPTEIEENAKPSLADPFGPARYLTVRAK